MFFFNQNNIIMRLCNINHQKNMKARFYCARLNLKLNPPLVVAFGICDET